MGSRPVAPSDGVVSILTRRRDPQKADFLGETAADPLDVDNPPAAPDNFSACPQVDRFEGMDMTRLTIKEILAGRLDVGAMVTVEGWIRTRRDSKAGLSFLQVHDGSCFDPIQVVAEATLPNYQDVVLHLTTHFAVRVVGTLVASQGKGQRFEVQAERVEVVGWVENPDSYPVSAKRHTFEHLRTVAHLRPRTNTFGAVSRVRDCLSMAVHRYFHERGFVWVHTPIITTSDAEGSGAMFRVSTLDLANLPRDERGQVDYSVDFFGKPAGLTVSGQLNVEAYCLALSRVYTFGPTFRAEDSNTTRHLAEFWMIEPEIAFADLSADADLAEDFLKSLFRAVLEERADDMAFFAQHIDKDCIRRLETFIAASFERMEYGEAIRRSRPRGRRAGSSSSPSSGASTCNPSTSTTSPRPWSGGRWSS